LIEELILRIAGPTRKKERGVTILIVGLSLLALVAMAALAIDVASLYVARGEAQRAADAAALAGAKIFVTSSYTSNPDAFPNLDVLCKNGNAGLTAAANQQAGLAAQTNSIAGQPAAVKRIDCNFDTDAHEHKNPRVTVTVERTGTPTFFARIWGTTSGTVTATATAEAYNASGLDQAIDLTNVKPWLLPNCNPNIHSIYPCADYFIDSTTGKVQNNPFIGKTIELDRLLNGVAGGRGGGTPPSNPGLNFYGLRYPNPPVPVCPAAGAYCGGSVGAGDSYIDNLACVSQVHFSCGQQIGPGSVPQILIQSETSLTTQPTVEGTQCLIHATDNDLDKGQDFFSTSGTPPVSIVGGHNNPNPALRDTPNISRSDSVVAVPLYDGHEMCADPPGGVIGSCGTLPAQPSATVIGFLQLGIQETETGPQVHAVILNAVGCSPNAIAAFPPTNPISGGGSSPIPVRLVRTP
jgi:hypothetical protein